MITHHKDTMLPSKNAENLRNYGKYDERGSIGIGAMIVFIALILVAAVASTVIIKTAEELQDRAEKTGDDTRDQISGKLIITDVYIATEDDDDGDIDSLAVIAKLASGSDATLETAMTYMIVCDSGGFATDTAAVNALNLDGTDIAATTALNSGEMFRFAIPVTNCETAAVVGASLPMTLNVEGGGDTRVDLEIETVAIGAKLI
jgi:flagellin FlaB